MQINKRQMKATLAALLTTGSFGLICSGELMAQSSAPQAGSSKVGGFLGFTDRDDADFTAGLEYEYQLDRNWSIGGVLEHTPDVVFDEDSTVVMATGNFRPTAAPRLKLTGGVGGEFRDYADDDVRFRVGAGYDLFIEGNLTLTPRIAMDFGDGDENIVVGATLFYNF